jgi:nucleotide-binding universal stress UspA family protein
MADIPQRILVPTDFSPTAESAFTLALHLAQKFGAELHLLHVRVIPEATYLEDMHQQEAERLLSLSDQHTEKALHREADSVEPITVQTHLMRGMSASEVVVAECTDLGCDLVVMGTHGHRGLKHLLLGSVAEAVVQTASVPVLTVRQEIPADRAAVDRILLAHDFSLPSSEAVQLAARWARTLEAELTLLHVIEPVVYPEFYAVDILPDDMLEPLKERSQKALEEFADTHLEGIRTRTAVTVGQPGDAITSEAETGGHDLVVMGKRGLNAFEHLLLGSVAEKVLRRCSVPVLTVRSHE